MRASASPRGGWSDSGRTISLQGFETGFPPGQGAPEADNLRAVGTRVRASRRSCGRSDTPRGEVTDFRV